VSWGALYAQFQLMEMRGEVRRGYFVQGLPGVQFALPEAVERLREWTRPQTPSAGEPVPSSTEELVLLNACDPANLFGPALPGAEAAAGEGATNEAVASEAAASPAGREYDPARFTRIPANYVVLLRGRPVLLLETGAERLTALPGLPPDTLRRALKLAVEHVGGSLRRLTLKEWNGQPILESPIAAHLEGLGFRREALIYVWE
jgi:ATP-dependent Lhr-like helicase